MGNFVLLHTEFFDHPMVLGLGNPARTLYLAGLCHSARFWTGGYIPDDAIPYLFRQVGVTEEAEVLDALDDLVGTGLWLAEEGGFLVAKGGRLPRWKLKGKAQRRRRATHKQRKETADQEERKSAAYRRWRAAVLARDNYQCAQCPTSDGLHVHHIKDFSLYPALRLEPDNGITLCLACHEIAHGRRLG